MKSKIIFLCNESDLTRERKGYYNALKSLGYEIIFVQTSENCEISKPEDYNFILLSDTQTLLPKNLMDLHIPIIGFHIDTFLSTKRRIKISELFDYTIVFHPQYENIFKRNGITHTHLLPHAVEKSLFIESSGKRIYDLGWVGSINGWQYKKRKKIVEILKDKYKMNEPSRNYSYSELTEIYKSSKLAVNISRDDYLVDANLRCFEIMASGALLLTMRPTELEFIGFKEGQHFVAFKNISELINKIEFYLANDEERTRITQAAKKSILTDHTYINRCEYLIKIIDNKKILKRAREINKDKLYLNYINFYSFYWMLDEAKQYYDKINIYSLYKIIGLYKIIKYKSLKIFFKLNKIIMDQS